MKLAFAILAIAFFVAASAQTDEEKFNSAVNAVYQQDAQLGHAYTNYQSEVAFLNGPGPFDKNKPLINPACAQPALDKLAADKTNLIHDFISGSKTAEVAAQELAQTVLTSTIKQLQRCSTMYGPFMLAVAFVDWTKNNKEAFAEVKTIERALQSTIKQNKNDCTAEVQKKANQLDDESSASYCKGEFLVDELVAQRKTVLSQLLEDAQKCVSPAVEFVAVSVSDVEAFNAAVEEALDKDEDLEVTYKSQNRSISYMSMGAAPTDKACVKDIYAKLEVQKSAVIAKFTKKEITVDEAITELTTVVFPAIIDEGKKCYFHLL